MLLFLCVLEGVGWRLTRDPAKLSGNPIEIYFPKTISITTLPIFPVIPTKLIPQTKKTAGTIFFGGGGVPLFDHGFAPCISCVAVQNSALEKYRGFFADPGRMEEPQGLCRDLGS